MEEKILEKTLYAVIRYDRDIVHDFHASDITSAISKIVCLVSDEYPHATGELKDMISGKIIYECRQRSIC